MATTERAARERIKHAQRELAAQPRGRKQVVEDFWASLLTDAVEEAKHAETLDDLRRWTEASGAVATLLRHSDAAGIARLLDTVQKLTAVDDEQPDAEALERWGRLHVLATLTRVREQSHTVSWLEAHGVSRQRLNQWRRQNRLFGIADVPRVKGFAYPSWQFTDALRPKPWLPDVLTAADAARLDPLSLHLFMTNPDAGNGRSPLEYAEAGDVDTTVALVTAANAQGG